MSAARQSYFLDFPKSTVKLWEAALPTLKEESKQCIGNLLRYRTPRTRARFPKSQSAAVLVPLFIGRAGDLYVLLNRRSESLRQYAGDTALPGGKVEPQDLTAEDTARREAFEEIGLAQDRERVPLLCVVEPFLAGEQMVVTPVVVLILDKTMQPDINESEVASIFSQPLASFLASSFPFPQDRTSADPSKPYHTTTDWSWSEGGTFRLHRFLTGRESDGVKPVFGLTAGILIHIAILGYGRAPDFELHPPNSPTLAQQLSRALLKPMNPLRLACAREGIDADQVAAFLLHPLEEPDYGPHTVEAQDRRRLMEYGETDVQECKSTTQKEVQEHCMEAEKDVDSDVVGDLNLCKGQVGKEEQHGEQSKPDTSSLSEHVDQIPDVVNQKRDAKL
ncbi:hypothetical protein K503DRAFT_774999 [Rhizopogon vinicolor AM-OR11-026]|uniref:Nudix hydrolase domain-containing protein n=1 Tax=Rhizopogon vinicolor AM-OR11-026 TaxID=1314800 RepID=A0A1B7MN28_9AGAM|nr:hypothetical protein K503DRAFT_774999 [Rhizopogon vinicolor AM-OR11-026]